MEKAAREVDALDAIAVGLSALSDAKVLDRFHERARAGLIEKALNEFGFVIVPKEPTEAMLKCGEKAAERAEHEDYSYDGTDEIRTT